MSGNGYTRKDLGINRYTYRCKFIRRANVVVNTQH